MGDDVKLVIGIFTAIIGVAIVSVIVSNSANTAGVISAATTGFGQDLSIAVSPVTGGNTGFANNALNGISSSLSNIQGSSNAFTDAGQFI